ncbi:MAG TPA: sigma-70 family RNA polymerase sigma factor [Chitinophagaceae bacterium]|nr:sigma-70 family RNA polymerase sigma factor [Chitinophagaceae bacterium]
MKASYKDIGSVVVQPIREDREPKFNQLFREHFRALSFFARSITGQELFAQDIVQECFIKVWKRYKQLTDSDRLKSYLYAAVKNDCISYLRKQAVRNKRREVYQEKVAVNQALSIEQEMVYIETVCELYAHIGRLPEKMREVVRLYYLEEKSAAEIGKLLQKNCDTVQHQRQTALNLLRIKKELLIAA